MSRRRGDGGVNVYRCPAATDLPVDVRPWHWGHLPARVRAGDVGRGIYRSG